MTHENVSYRNKPMLLKLVETHQQMLGMGCNGGFPIGFYCMPGETVRKEYRMHYKDASKAGTFVLVKKNQETDFCLFHYEPDPDHAPHEKHKDSHEHENGAS